MTDFFLSGVRSLVSTSPSAAVGVTQSKGPPKLSSQQTDWTYEKLISLSNPVLVEILHSVPGRLESRTLTSDTVIPGLVKLFGSTNNAAVKTACCSVIVTIAGGGAAGGTSSDNADVGLLIVNILLQDLQDPNPDNRANAVTTICSLPILIQSYATQAVSTGLKDSNPRVRKQAVIGCGKAWSHCPDFITESGLIDNLYTMIRDPDHTVLTFALQTLNIILKSEGGVVINNPMVQYLLTRLDDCPDTELILLLNYLRLNRSQKDSKRAEETSLKIMNAVDGYLEAKNGSLALAAMYLFTQCVASLQQTQHVVKDFMAKTKPQISRFLNLKGHSNDDFKVSLMDFVMSLPPDAVASLLEIVADFHLKPRDSRAVAVAKLGCLSFIFQHTCASQEDPTAVVEYLLKILPETKEKFVSRAIVSTLCDLLKHQQQQTTPTKLINSQKVFQTFLKLITSPESSDEDVKGIWDQIHNERLDQYQLEQEFIEDFANELCEKAVIHLSKNTDAPEVEVVRQLLHFISIHQGLEMAPYYLEAVTNDIFDRSLTSLASESTDGDVVRICLYEELFFSALAVTAKQPAPTQHILVKVVHKCKSLNIPELNDRIDNALRSAFIQDEIS